MEPETHMHISYAVAMSMATLQATSLLLMIATSADKALSLLKPLHYNEIMTFTTVKVYMILSLLISILVGVIIPLTFNITWNSGNFHYFMALPFGPTPESKIQLGLLVFFTLPCGLLVIFCHIYVYNVANRHAKAIRRDDSVRDRMMSSPNYRLTVSSEAGVMIGMEAAVSNYLTIPNTTNQPRHVFIILKIRVVFSRKCYIVYIFRFIISLVIY